MYDDLYGYTKKEKIASIVPIMLLVFVTPLIVFGKFTELTGDYYKYWNGANMTFDFFSYYKSNFIIIMAIIALSIFLFKVLKKDIHISKQSIYISMAVYSVFVILSTIFSPFKQIAVFGFVERYEGLIVILCYMAILFITMNVIDSEYKVKVVLWSLIVSAAIIGTIGIFQYFNHDLFQSSFGKKIIMPSGYKNLANRLKFSFGPKIIYSTLYHYNYVGSYMAMLFPLSFTMALLIKNKIYKIGLSAVSILMFLNLILSHSRAGVVGGMVSLIILIIMLRKHIIDNWKYYLGAILIASIAFAGFNYYSKGMLGNRVGSLFKDAGNLSKDNGFYIKDIYSENNVLNIETNKNNLAIVSENNRLNFKDDKGNFIGFSINQDSGNVILNSDKYKDFNIKLKDYSSKKSRNNLELNIAGSKIPILVDSNKFKFVDKRRGEVELKKIDKWGFEGKEKVGSARGYIWSRSIPLIKNTVLMGYGPDTFPIRFPQEDFIGKILGYNTPKMFVDKAHNVYLQQAINTGVISLIAFLSMFIIYFISCIKLYFKNNFEDFYSIVGLAIFTAVVGYLGAGFFNDSVVSVAPVFWVLFGMGLAINHKLKNDKVSDAKEEN